MAPHAILVERGAALAAALARVQRAPVAVDGEEGAVAVQLVDDQNVPPLVGLPGVQPEVVLELRVPPAVTRARPRRRWMSERTVGVRRGMMRALI